MTYLGPCGVFLTLRQRGLIFPALRCMNYHLRRSESCPSWLDSALVDPLTVTGSSPYPYMSRVASILALGTPAPLFDALSTAITVEVSLSGLAARCVDSLSPRRYGGVWNATFLGAQRRTFISNMLSYYQKQYHTTSCFI